ncbi:MAG: alpha/beta fold hydrolase [Aerococcaceae bacterium]|nr:alpha/beta fold hydrolase [Aerococcaceae bacterium]
MELFLEGNRPVGVVLLHAYTGSVADVNLLARELHKQGYSVLCPLFEGHGTGDIHALLAQGPDVWWQQTQAAVAQLKARCQHVFVFGLSMGGMFATRALLDLDVTAGGCFNSPIVTKAPVNLERPFMAYAQFLYAKKGLHTQFDLDKEHILAKHREQLGAIQAFVGAYRKRLEDLQQPYYIAQSAQDELIDADDAYDLQNALENADFIDFNWFIDNTHVITVNSNRKAFEESVQQFIEKVLQRKEEAHEFI